MLSNAVFWAAAGHGMRRDCGLSELVWWIKSAFEAVQSMLLGQSNNYSRGSR